MSGVQEYHNNLRSTLTLGVTAVETSLQIASSTFPTVTPPKFYLLALESVDGAKLEVVKVVDVSGVTLTVERGFEGTAQEFSIGDIVQCRNTAQTMNRAGQKSDLGEPFPHTAAVVNSTLQVYIDPAGDDVNGDGSLGSPWQTLQRALDEASLLRFSTTGFFIINCAAGTYQMTGPIIFDHPEGSQIHVVSETGVTPISGVPIADYTADRETPNVPARGATEFYNTAGTLAQSATSTTRTTARDSDRANNRTLAASLGQAVFDWSSAGDDDAKVLVTTAVGYLDNLTFTAFSPGSTFDNRSIIKVGAGAKAKISNVTVVGGAVGLHIVGNGVVEATQVSIAGSFHGLRVDTGGVITVGTLFVQGIVEEGVFGLGSSVIEAANIIITGCGLRGIRLGQASDMSGNEADWVISGNGSLGVGVETGATASNRGFDTIISGNKSAGLDVQNSASFLSGGIQCIGNREGINLESQGSALGLATGSQPKTIIVNNSSFGIEATSGGICVNRLDLDCLNNGGDAIRVRDAGAIRVGRNAVIIGNTGRVFAAEYASPCALGDLTCDLTNIASPHLVAVGGSQVRSVAPGDGGVDPGIVYSPAFGTTTPPDSSLFQDTVL